VGKKKVFKKEVPTVEYMTDLCNSDSINKAPTKLIWIDTNSLVCDDLTCFSGGNPAPTPQANCFKNSLATPTFISDLIKTIFTGFEIIKASGVGFSEKVDVCKKKKVIAFYENQDRILQLDQNPCTVEDGEYVWTITSDGQFSFCPVFNNLNFGASLQQCANCRDVYVGGQLSVYKQTFTYNFNGTYESLHEKNKAAVEKNMELIWNAITKDGCKRKFVQVSDDEDILPTNPPSYSYAKKLCKEPALIYNPNRILWEDSMKQFCTDLKCLDV